MADFRSATPSLRHDLQRGQSAETAVQSCYRHIFSKKHMGPGSDRVPSEISVHSRNENCSPGKSIFIYQPHTLHEGYCSLRCTKTLSQIPNEKHLFQRGEFLFMLTALVSVLDKKENLCQSLLFLSPHMPALQYLAKDSMMTRG